MKKKIMGIIAIVAVAAIAGYNVYTSQNNIKLSDLALANVEALAQSEDTSDTSTCGDKGGKCWRQHGECMPAYGIVWDDCEYTGKKSDSCQTPCPSN